MLARKILGATLIAVPVVGMIGVIPAEASTGWHYSKNYTSSAKYFTGGIVEFCDRQLNDGWGPAVHIDGSAHNLTFHGADGNFTGGSVEKCWKSNTSKFHLGSKVRIKVGNYDIRTGAIYSYGAYSGWAKR